MKKKQKESYYVQFKLDVLKLMERTGSSVIETALQFGLTNSLMITSRKKVFLGGGVRALDKPKGRPLMSDKAKN